MANGCAPRMDEARAVRRLTLPTGNSSWWKARKYRRETAAELRGLRRDGWRLAGIDRQPPRPYETRRFTVYTLVR